MEIFSDRSVAPPSGVAAPAYNQLEWPDYAMIGAYFAVTLWMAYVFSRRQHSAEEYFLAGRRMPWFAVGLSLMATLTSTVSYLATPGEVIQYGLIGVMGGILFYPIIYLVIGYVLAPLFLRLRITSIYEYLERRFDVRTRMFASVVFLVIRLNWMGLVLYSSTLALEQITRVDRLFILIGIGVIAVVYTTLGGMRAVIWTDVAQFFILFSGALFTAAYVMVDTGTGLGAWWQTMSAGSRPAQPLFSFDPHERVTLVGMGLMVFFWYVCTYAGDQVAVQRLMSTSSPSAARRSSACDLISGVIVSLALAVVGLALYAYYAGQAPVDADQVFPYFIRSQLPRGLAGLVVAALFSAAMSSLDSGMNSIATVISVDYVGRWRSAALGATAQLILARGLTVAVGAAAILMCTALFLIPQDVRGNLLELAQRMSSFPVGALGGLFFVAIWVRRCRSAVAIQATCAGMLCGLVVGWGHTFGVFREDRPLSFMWIIPSSCLVTLVYAALISAIRPRIPDRRGNDIACRENQPVSQPKGLSSDG